MNQSNEQQAKKHRRRCGIGFALATVLLFLAFGWRYAVPVDVVATGAKPAALQAELFAPGIVDAGSRVQLSSEIGGCILELNAEAGDAVTAGDVLVRMQSDSADALLHQTQAQLTSARAQLAAACADLDSATATAEHEDRDHRRLETLAEKQPDAVAQSDLDISATALATARAGELRARSQRRAAESEVSAAEAAVAYQQALQAKTALVAPFAGVVARRIRSIGDTVEPGAGILELVDPSTLFIQARFDESLLPVLSRNASARAVFYGETRDGIPGHVERIDRVVDGETREFLAEIALDTLPPHWALGQRADVYIKSRVPVAVSLPRRFVQRNSNGAFVWMMRGHRAVRRPVTIGLTTADTLQIVSGLAENDCVIRPDIHLYSGRRVRPSEIGTKP